MRIAAGSLVAVFFVLSFSLQAHHGWAEFDLDREITVEGTVTDFHFINPHCVVEFLSKEHKWQGEFSNPAQLSRRGWNAGSLQPGDRITMTGHPAKNGVYAVYVQRIRVADGPEMPVENK